jgi:cytochrome b subunit of formate dehydrogenase
MRVEHRLGVRELFGRSYAAGSSLLLLAALSFAAGPAAAQDNQTCLMCHNNPAMFQGRPDAAQLVVRPEVFDASAHGAAGMQCVMCHSGLTFPHPEEVPAVDCNLCHRTQADEHGASLHGQAAARGDPLAPSCVDCHGTHDVQSHRDPRSPTAVMNIPFLCGECHQEGTSVSRTRNIPQDRILENYSMSIHGAGLFEQGLTVTAVCTSCHTSHNILPHTDPGSSIHHENVAATCTQCHAQIEQVHVQVIEGRLWEEQPHLIPACVDCHAPHRIRRVFYESGAANADCMGCHGDSTLVGVARGDSMSLFVDEPSFVASTHAETPCAQCHTEVTPGLHRPCSTVEAPVDCSICHEDQVRQHEASMHGQLAAENDPDAPTCLDCHDRHATLDNRTPASPTFPRNVPELCARCHRVGEAAAVRIEEHEREERIMRDLLEFAQADTAELDLSEVPPPVESYGMSIHGKGLYESGLLVTATCTSCHTAHQPLPADDPRSSIHPDNVAGTCGTCHHGIEETFGGSIHSPGVGDPELTPHDLPTCEDCHTSHTIRRVDQPDFRMLTMDQCGRCHEDEAETFFDTFHGKVSRLGEAAAAKCYDCHGTHNILPVTHAASTLSRRNVVETCSQCHTGVNMKFTGYLTHATHHDPAKYPFLFWAFWGMTALLVGTLSFAMLHTLAWLWRMLRSPGVWQRHHAKPGEKLYRRFNSFQRTLHLVMLLSFFVLALTGMVLKFSYMGWAQVSAKLAGGFATTGVLHRFAAVVLIGVFFTHLWDARRQKRASGLTWWQFITSKSSIIFNKRDLVELGQSVKWFLGRGPRPKYGRYTYWEKFDYFAVFWGMFVIGSTGVLLWFPEFFTMVLPGWTVNVATIVHSDEALLAVAFIFTVHFFNTHFRPDKFPMDPVIFTGRVPMEEFKRDKPDEYEDLVKQGELEEHLVDPYPPRAQRAFKILGFTALAIGLTLIALIVYSMLFGYR